MSAIHSTPADSVFPTFATKTYKLGAASKLFQYAEMAPSDLEVSGEINILTAKRDELLYQLGDLRDAMELKVKALNEIRAAIDGLGFVTDLDSAGHHDNLYLPVDGWVLVSIWYAGDDSE